MIRKYLIMSMVALGLLTPVFANAQEIATESFDNFSAFQSTWNDASSNINWTTSGCNTGGCVFVTSGGNFNFYDDTDFTPTNTVAFTVWMKLTGGVENLPVFRGVIAGDTPSCSTHCIDTRFNLASNDGVWHEYTVAWQPDTLTGVYQECVLVDDTDLADCGWNDNYVMTPDSLNITGLAVLTDAAPSSGGSWYVDDLNPLGSPAAPNTTTHIETVIPASGSTIASSTAATFGATGYINPNDFTSGMTLTMKYAPYVSSQEVVACVSCLFTTITFPITSSGAFSFSTTSPATVTGNYTMTSSIQGAQSVGFFGFNFTVPFLSNQFTSTSTTFIVNQLNGFDVYIASSTALINSYLGSSTISLASCSSFTSFNLGDCVNLLLVPQAGPMQQLYQSFQSQFLSYFPWGYATRFINILSENGTTTLPSATATVWTPYSAGGLNDNSTFTVDPTATLAAASDALDSVDANGTSLNWQGVLEPYVELFIAVSLLFIIVFDLIGTVGRSAHSSSRRGKIS